MTTHTHTHLRMIYNGSSSYSVNQLGSYVLLFLFMSWNWFFNGSLHLTFYMFDTWKQNEQLLILELYFLWWPGNTKYSLKFTFCWLKKRNHLQHRDDEEGKSCEGCILKTFEPKLLFLLLPLLRYHLSSSCARDEIWCTDYLKAARLTINHWLIHMIKTICGMLFWFLFLSVL